MKYTGLIVLFAPVLLQAQGFADTGYLHYSFDASPQRKFTLHITKSAGDQKKPLILYMDGSGNFPVYYKTNSGRYSTTTPLSIRKYAKDYYIAVISKPGVAFKDSLRYSNSGRGYYPATEYYDSVYSLDWRAETASAAIDFLITHFPVDPKRIIVMGYSEGAQVAPRVAVLNKRVTHVVCFAGNALNQLYDFLLDARLQAARNEISREESQRIVDSLFGEYEKIYREPHSVKDSWYGATYLKWSSFSNTTPLESMLQLTIPILYIAGGRDNNQTILDMDYAKLEFLRKKKTNLTYKVYPDCDHYFQDERLIDGTVKKTDRIDEVHQFAIDWTNTVKQ